ncbi:unnamed protein product [Acanthoscelides obtectus]|uniref:U3 small nucleolar RNA-associated protein 13 C-terminal domain-containing protein n=1 Tax=Acanthoscelides obtectus TaxID=200917 RepID=A0A9P0Q2U8_ACAOB|nr:unnamed protein product [Acanthoscelides obtectus]CAK1638263.1 Transducin beta-like protein 3 [Acanthoscelides obtectus]
MANKPKLKEAFEVETKYGAFYTGGNVEWHEDILYCQTDSNISLLNTDNGTVEKFIGEQSSEDIDVVQTFTTDGRYLITSHRSGLLKMWNEKGELEKTWKYIHIGPIAKLALKGMKLASGGSDSIVRLWDLEHQACQLGLKGCQGVVSVVEFHLEQDLILASGDDGKINCYELQRGEVIESYNAHYSKVTALVFSPDTKHFVTCGRDKVIILWEFGNTTALKTIPTYQAVEVIVGLPKKFKLPGFKSESDGIYVASAGEKGVISIWDVCKAKQVYLQTNSLVTPASEEGGLAVTHLRFHMKSKSLAVVTVDQNIIIYHLKSFACLKQFIGFSDEILDITYVGKDDSYIAVATNSNDIKLYESTTMTCQLLKGHTDLVLALSANKSNPDLMLSSSKDNTVRLWLLEGSTMSCIAVGMRHTASVGTVAFSTSMKFVVSASQDTCVKVWEIPEQKKNATLECLHTEIAHQKDINCVAVSPNDKIIATASQDKTAKLWTETLTLVGVLRGHKRGVWSVRFSPVDQVVMTSSADCTIKLWSVADLSCLKTFEGHEASVLKAEFISSGLQIVSTGADGLIKLFTIKSSECVGTLDQHEARVWALAIKKDESEMVTGGSDSILIKWKDVTEELKLRRLKEAEEMALQEQQLSNYLQNEQYLKAMKLALRLNKPMQVLKIVENIIKKGDGGLAETISGLRNDQKENLMKTAISWNMNSRHCHPAQLVLNILLNELQTGEFSPAGLGSSLEGALPYTERHFKRLTQMMQDLNFMTYMINCMTPHAKVTE